MEVVVFRISAFVKEFNISVAFALYRENEAFEPIFSVFISVI